MTTEDTNKKKKKIAIIAGSTVAAVLVVGLSAFAAYWFWPQPSVDVSEWGKVKFPLNYDEVFIQDIELRLAQGTFAPERLYDGGDNAVHVAARMRKFDLVNKVIDEGADINARNFRGYTPLLSAVEALDIEVVECLLEREADPEKVNNVKETALSLLFMAKKENRLKVKAILNLLLEAGANPFHKKDPKDIYATIPIRAMTFYDLDMVKKILELEGMDVFFKTLKNPLVFVANLEVSKQLDGREFGAEILKNLISFGLDVTETSKTYLFSEKPLIKAIQRGSVERVKVLLDAVDGDKVAGILNYQVMGYGMTALMEAASLQNAKIVELLLEKGADPNLSDGFYGRRASDYARENTEILNLLKQYEEKNKK